ncbi:MAG: aminopeptidase [Planctomycetota bacterium]|jgi:leucyl aminopeptidase (aminopeptidase T)
MGTIEQGVKQAVENCLRVQPGEKALIITDEQTMEIGLALKAAIEEITDPVQFFVMEDFGVRPIDMPSVIEEAISSADVSIYAAQGAEGELQTFRRYMLAAIEANPNLRHGHMPGITPQIMCDGMCSDYNEIQRISRLVYEKVKDANEIRVITENGCDVTARFSPELRWHISDGDIRKGQWKNLPDGEVLTSPVDVNGVAVFDGCLGDYFEKYASIADTPLTVKVENGRAIKESIDCANEQLREEFIEYLFENDENSDRVGEFAIGTNTGLTELIYNLLQDEKFPSVHIAFGNPLAAHTGADWDSQSHVDGLIVSPTVIVDGETIMDKGEFRLE